MNFYVTFFIGTYYLALSISRLLLIIFSFVISYFPYFKLVALKTLVILCNTLKKEGRAFRNIGKNISLHCVISLANFRLLFNLLLIRSSTARGSGTSILLRWFLQKLTFYKSAFYKSMFYKSTFYKSAFCKSTPCFTNPLQSTPLKRRLS